MAGSGFRDEVFQAPGAGREGERSPSPSVEQNLPPEENRTEGANFVRFGAQNFRLTPVTAPVLLLPAGGKIKKDRRGRRRSLGKEWRRVWKMCLGFLFNMQTACQKTLGTAQ